jgi:hypothetical protein
MQYEIFKNRTTASTTAQTFENLYLHRHRVSLINCKMIVPRSGTKVVQNSHYSPGLRCQPPSPLHRPTTGIELDAPLTLRMYVYMCVHVSKFIFTLRAYVYMNFICICEYVYMNVCLCAFVCASACACVYTCSKPCAKQLTPRIGESVSAESTCRINSLSHTHTHTRKRIIMRSFSCKSVPTPPQKVAPNTHT